MLQSQDAQTINSLIAGAGAVSLAINAFFVKRLVDRQDQLGNRLHKVESKLTAVLVNMGLRNLNDEEDES